MNALRDAPRLTAEQIEVVRPLVKEYEVRDMTYRMAKELEGDVLKAYRELKASEDYLVSLLSLYSGWTPERVRAWLRAA